MTQDKKPFISILLPAYNEEVIIEKGLYNIMDYLESLKDKYRYEILVINDGSEDKTGDLADSFAVSHSYIRVFHHPINLNLGRALQTGFRNAKGEIIVVLDLDLSYSVDHVEKLVDMIISTNAEIVIASPYMRGGMVTKVPFFRLFLSRSVNRFMRFAAQQKLYTFTSMVRAYKAEFIQNLNLKSKDYEINPEILYKSMVLRARIIEVPAHLDWSFQIESGKGRKSSIRMLKTFLSGLMAAFIFRPYIFFISLGVVILFLALYIIAWIFVKVILLMPTIITDSSYFDEKFSVAAGQVFQESPHSFIVGGITLVLAIQVLALGFLSLQSKRYFEELFHMNTSISKFIRKEKSAK